MSPSRERTEDADYVGEKYKLCEVVSYSASTREKDIRFDTVGRRAVDTGDAAGELFVPGSRVAHSGLSGEDGQEQNAKQNDFEEGSDLFA